MQLQWSLDELYTSFESDEFKKDFSALKSEINKLNNWAKENLSTTDNSTKKLEEIINLQNDFGHLITNLLNYCELTMSSDATNEKALQIINQIEDIETELTPTNVALQKWIGKLLDLENIISHSELLKEHAYYIKDLKEKDKYTLSEAEETIIAKMQNTGSASWTKLQELLTSTILIDIDINGKSKKLPLPAIRNLAYEANPKLRKTGYDAELNFYPKIADSVAACLSGIKGEVITVSKLKGYASPLDMTLIHSRMDSETLNAMLEAINESLPIFQKYFRKKAELLGYKNGLPFYELFAPMGNSNMSFTYEQAASYIVDKFTTFSEKLGSFAKYAFDNNWIDVEPREGKRGGAFCSNLHSIKQSRILTNFTGSFSDVITLAHELGHAYHGDCLNNESYLNSDYPMPIAETASTFCETIINQAALKTASKEEAFTILESSISDAAQVVVDILSRFIFEDKVFKRREISSLSVKELCELMLSAQKEAYGDGLDSNSLHPYMWLCKSHYYDANYNYYNFPYAFGLLFSKGLYAEYLKSGEKFVKDYDNLLSSTGKNNLADVAVMVGTDIRSKDFWRSSLKLIEADIEKFIQL
jgi:pepF/M3 family oligoendopeptidase